MTHPTEDAVPAEEFIQMKELEVEVCCCCGGEVKHIQREDLLGPLDVLVCATCDQEPLLCECEGQDESINDQSLDGE